MYFRLGIGLVAVALGGLFLVNRQMRPISAGTVLSVKVHGKSLVGNLEKDFTDRDVSIYLPASYQRDTSLRYPVVYLLHGFDETDERWFGSGEGSLQVQLIADRLLGHGLAQEMILVMPNAYTAFRGSMYSDSVTTGNWEAYIAKDLVSYIDTHYRTQAEVSGRGLAGHSMGGYGALRIGMKYPGVFSSIYLLSPCCLADGNPERGVGQSPAEDIKNFEDVQRASSGVIAILARAAAWSPDPDTPPLFLDLPKKNGQIQPDVAAKWAANSPIKMLEQYAPNLKILHIALDVGVQDRQIDPRSVQALHEALEEIGVAHNYELFEGDHTSRLAERIETHVVPFFSKTLQ
jgi:S-formylglutathione hydrolase